jgi:flagellar M-ring protein FliF
MASDSQNLVTRFSSISAQPGARQLRLLLGLAASIALGLSLVQWATSPDFTPLYGELSPASSAEIIGALESSGVSYTVNGAGIVSVPTNKVSQLRLQLAAEGLPKSDGSGFDMLYDEPRMGVSSFMEKARYDHALEEELAKSVTSLDSVRSAVVHLALPKQSAFVRKKNKPAASVLVNLYAGRKLTERQLAGVVHMIAYSVPGLEADQVSVVDNRGNLLSSQAGDDEAEYIRENLRYSQQLEQSYVDRIDEILAPVMGVGAMRSQVVASIDFTVTEQTLENYGPEVRIRSEQLSEEINNRTDITGGVPGTLSNQPPAQATIAGAGAAGPDPVPPVRSSTQEVRNYELDKTISHIRETPGTLKKLSVAVVVDYQEVLNASGVLERQPLSAERMAVITGLVKQAVGFDQGRGDTLEVMNTSFVVVPIDETVLESSIVDQEWFWRSIKYALGSLATLLVIFTVVRPLMQASSHSPPAGRPSLGGSADGGDYASASPAAMSIGDDRVTLGNQHQLGAPAYQQQLTMARSMVEGEPERAAHVVKNWMTEDG